MNLHALATPLVSAVNPIIPVTVRQSTGYTTASDGTRTPTFDDTPDVPAQIQALTYGDIQMLDGLQIQGERRKLYLNGKFDSLNRTAGTGGDRIVFPDGDVWPFGTRWKVAYVFEQWPDWVSIAVTRQVDDGC